MTIIKANGAGDQSTDFYNGVATQSLRFDRPSTPYLVRTPSSSSQSLQLIVGHGLGVVGLKQQLFQLTIFLSLVVVLVEVVSQCYL